jgi:pimeloyl-ACP methyl ester carboxylesterase
MMHASMSSCVFVPGLGAPAGLYAPGLPAGWEALELPTFRETRGRFGAYREFVRGEVARRDRVVLAGHSMGGALSLLAAVDEPERVAELILLAPAGLPLGKSMRASAVTFAHQLLRRRYPPRQLARMAANLVAAPRDALRLARTVHDLDLRPELGPLRDRGIPRTVVACSGDELVTPAHCRRLAALLDADFREVSAPGGHIWVIAEPWRLAAELARRG